MSIAMPFPVPENEPQRLEALLSYGVLDTPPELEFDAPTRIASHALKTPAAVVGLVDSERLWFKSRLGLDVPQLDRQIAFCAHAIMRPGELLVVEDLAEDGRFRDSPLVTAAPHVRFYAGAPLVDSRGYALGTIAVVDTRPRSLSEQEKTTLRDLSVLVVSVLENRLHARRLGRMALTDHLTGLGNRASFEQSLKAEMAHARRSAEPMSLLCMDLNGFKPVNDQYGHAAGDEVLCEVGARLRELARAEDAVCRLGGDEFSLIARATSLAAACALADRIARAVAVPIVLSGGDKLTVGISIGVATLDRDTLSEETLLARADKALYDDKRQRAAR